MTGIYGFNTVNNMKVAVLYIATKRYVELWKDFHETAERFFLPGTDKGYFIFTDQPDVFTESGCVVTEIDDVPEWYAVSMNRFDYFLLKEKELQGYDYAFFFNANTIFRHEVTPESILPTEENDGLVGCAIYKIDRTAKCYEENTAFACHIPMEERGDYYYNGALIGGRTAEFMDVCSECSAMTQADREKGLLPLTHDEAYYNKALSGKHPLLIRFASHDAAAGSDILFRSKRDVFGDSYLRGLKRVRLDNNKWIKIWKLLQSKQG